MTAITSGVRRRDDGREQEFTEFKTAALGPGESTPAKYITISLDLFDGLTDQDYEAAFVFWVRFRVPGGARWEVVYDPIEMVHSGTVLR